MASIKDVAKRAGVSTATVSRVLNNHPSVVPETRQAVRDAMDYLCYVPSKSSFQLSGKCSGLIGVVLPKEGANKQVISSQADSLIKISRIWADFFPANTSN